jgi:NAD(P)H-flavin reductase
MTSVPWRVKRVQKETADTFTLELARAEGPDGLPFRPGQFNMLYVFGVGEVPISISGDPSAPSTLTHTTRAVGSVTRAMRGLGARDVLGVRGPLGTHWPIEEAFGSDLVLVAGGIGLAPLRPAMHAVLARREKFGKVVLLYGARTPADILYRKEIEEWRARFDLEVHVTVDRAIGSWRGNVGVVPALVPKAPFDPANTVALVCGPEVMMRFSVAALEKRGVEATGIWLSMERNMKCGIGLCGHCQWGPFFVCRDGPVFRYDRIRDLFGRREI